MLKGRSFTDRGEKWAGSPESIPYGPGKWIFLGLLAISAAVVLLAGFVLWYVPSYGLQNIHPVIPYILGGTLLVLAVVVVGGGLLLTVVILKGGAFPQSCKLRGLLVKFFLPLMVMLGGLLRIPKVKIEQSFVDINNQLVRGMDKKVRPEHILLLMPHCIQYLDCRIKVTQNVRNCVGCNKCEIADLIGVSDEFGVDLFISTGGTIARRKVYEKRPDAIIAVACERDLTSGIQDAYPLPVFGIINKRPRGYCVATGVDVASVREAVNALVG